MGGIIAGFIVLFVFIVIAVSKNSAVAGRNRLAQSGLRGRGLVLQSSMNATGMRVGMQRFEQRQMTLDIEIPGRAPYVVQGTFMTPRGLVEPIPGASLDVSVDPNNPSAVVVLGPGGFSGPWLQTGPPQPY
jgi:hypothetical protein